MSFLGGEQLVCPSCGAVVMNPETTECWMCDFRVHDGQQSVWIASSDAATPAQETVAWYNRIAAILISNVLLLTFVGLLLTDAPGMAVLLLIFLVPWFARVFLGWQPRQEGGGVVSVLLKVLMGFATVVGGVILVGIAAVAALFLICLVNPPF